MIRTWIVRYNPLVRRISTSSNLRPRAAICLTFGGLKQPFAGFSARRRLCTSLAPRSYRPCPGLLAPISAAVFTATRSSSLQPARGPQMASLAVKGDAPRSSIVQQDLPRTAAEDGDRAISVQREISSQRPDILRLPSASEGEPVAMLQPNATREQVTPSSKTSRVLDPEEIKLLMKQGEQLIAAGDVATARTVLRRAADAGDANAAMALGATYDPNVLARLGVVGVSAEVEKARSWYQKAETLGSPDARRRLDLLANR
jgi:hypothetical protein